MHAGICLLAAKVAGGCEVIRPGGGGKLGSERDAGGSAGGGTMTGDDGSAGGTVSAGSNPAGNIPVAATDDDDDDDDDDGCRLDVVSLPVISMK